MKLTRDTLKKIIKEELEELMQVGEAAFPPPPPPPPRQNLAADLPKQLTYDQMANFYSSLKTLSLAMPEFKSYAEAGEKIKNSPPPKIQRLFKPRISDKGEIRIDNEDGTPAFIMRQRDRGAAAVISKIKDAAKVSSPSKPPPPPPPGVNSNAILPGGKRMPNTPPPPPPRKI